MASYVADTKEDAEAKNELITLLMGVLMFHSDATLELSPEREAMWEKPDGTKFLAPTVSQRNDYILEVRRQTLMLGRDGRLWQDRNGAKTCGMEAVREFLLIREKEAFAARLRETASKLTSAAARISSPKPRVGIRPPPRNQKRRREEDFGEVEENLLETVRVVREFKKIEQSYQPLRAGQFATRDTAPASPYSAPQTRSSAQVVSPKGTFVQDAGRGTGVARATSYVRICRKQTGQMAPRPKVDPAREHMARD